MTKRVDFYFDFASVYSYLAQTQLERLVERTGAELHYRPMVLMAVFKAAANSMPASSPPKAQYLVRDVQRWVARYDVPFRFSPYFPQNCIAAGRLVVASRNDPKLATALFRAAWVEGRDVSSEAELTAIADAVGLDGKALVAATATQAVKDGLRANTDEAIARGVFGAPSFYVGDELFFGNDRLDFVEDALKR